MRSRVLLLLARTAREQCSGNPTSFSRFLFATENEILERSAALTRELNADRVNFEAVRSNFAEFLTYSDALSPLAD